MSAIRVSSSVIHAHDSPRDRLCRTSVLVYLLPPSRTLALADDVGHQLCLEASNVFESTVALDIGLIGSDVKDIVREESQELVVDLRHD